MSYQNSYARKLCSDLSQALETSAFCGLGTPASADGTRKGWTNVEIRSKHWGAMLGRLSIFVVTACVLNAVAYGESISFQRHQGLVTKGHAVLGTMQFDTVFHAIGGDPGRGFSNAEHRSLIQPTGRELRVDAMPRGSLIRSVNRQLNFGFYRRSQFAQQSAADFILRTLLDRKPKGRRGRRELAEANAKK